MAIPVADSLAIANANTLPNSVTHSNTNLITNIDAYAGPNAFVDGRRNGSAAWRVTIPLSPRPRHRCVS